MAKIKLSGRKVCVRNRKLLPCCGQTEPTDPCCLNPKAFGVFPKVSGQRHITSAVSTDLTLSLSAWKYKAQTDPPGIFSTAPPIAAQVQLAESRTVDKSDSCYSEFNPISMLRMAGGWQASPLAGQVVSAQSVAISGAADLYDYTNRSVAGVVTYGGQVAINGEADDKYNGNRNTTSATFARSPTFDPTRVVAFGSMFLQPLGYYQDGNPSNGVTKGAPTFQIGCYIDDAGRYAVELSTQSAWAVTGTATGPLVSPGNFTVHLNVSAPAFQVGQDVPYPAWSLVGAFTMTSNMQPCAAPFVPVDGEDPILHFNHVVRNMT